MTSACVLPIPVRPKVIAYRKACPATGIGLSHYVLAKKAPVRSDAPAKESAS